MFWRSFVLKRDEVNIFTITCNVKIRFYRDLQTK